MDYTPQTRKQFSFLRFLYKAMRSRMAEAAMVQCSPSGNATFFPTDIFPWIEHIEAHWPIIRRECEAILQDRDRLPNFHDISPDQYALSKDHKWKTYFLYGFGRHKSAYNCGRCPETTRVIETIPGMLTAFFSILAPGKHIPPHRGAYKGILRYHLGVIVPTPRSGCRIRVGKDVAHWEEGKSLVFDDRYEHEAWNDTSGERVVLFVDFIRPLRFPMSVLNRAALAMLSHSNFVQTAMRNQDLWDERLHDRQRTQSS